MASVNKVIIMGNLGRDPEVRHTSSGSAICNAAVATTRNWKNKESGERQEETEWHRVVFYDRLAEIAGEYLKKGKPVYIEGRLKTRKWQNKDGQDVYTTEIIAETMQLLGGRDDAGQQSEERQPQRRQQQAPQRSESRSESRSGGGGGGGGRAKSGTGFDDMDDDIPFVTADLSVDTLFVNRKAARLAR